MFNLIPNLQGFAIPKRAAIVFWSVVGVIVLFLAVLGYQLPAILILGIGLCSFALTDVLISIKENPPVRRSRKIQTVFTCCLSGGVMVFCVYVLVTYLIS